jgi:hypothetical protein
LVVYDFGLLNKVDKQAMNTWVRAYQYQDMETLVDLALSKSYEYSLINDQVKRKILEKCVEMINPNSKMIETLRVLVPIMRKYNIKLKNDFLSTLVSFALTEKVLGYLERGTICVGYVDTHNSYVSNCLDIIAFCECRGTCLLLKEQLENEVKKIKLTKMFTRNEPLFDDCKMDEFYSENTDFNSL